MGGAASRAARAAGGGSASDDERGSSGAGDEPAPPPLLSRLAPASAADASSTPPSVPSPTSSVAATVATSVARSAAGSKDPFGSAVAGSIFAAISDVASRAASEKGLPYSAAELGPPRPPGNVERVAHLRSACADHLNPTRPDAQIENVVSLICRLFGVEDALLALLDGERVFIRSAAGRRFALGDFPWRCSFCGWSLANPTPQTLIVQDATADARFASNPFVVGPPFLRFYAGAPVVSRSNGHRLGTLCFADFKPRHLGPAGAATLNTLADLVAAELDRQAASAAAQRAAAALARVPSTLRGADRVADGALLVDARSALERVDAGSGSSSDSSTTLPPWPVLHASAAAAAALGLSGAGEGADLWSLFDLPAPHAGAPSTSAVLAAAAARGRFFVLRGVRARSPPTSPPTSAASDAAPPPVSRGTRLYDLTFWPSALGPPSTAVGTAGPVGVPASIVAAGAGADLDPGAGVFCVTLALAFASGGGDSPRAAGGAAARRPVLPAALCSNGSPLSTPPPPPLPGLELDVLVGRGAHGTVHAGRWKGDVVAVKIVPDDARVARAANGAPLEATLAPRLPLHPNIVCVRAVAHSAPPASPHDSAGSMDAGDVVCGGPAASASRGGGATWLVLDFCDGGTLRDAVERGVLADWSALRGGGGRTGAAASAPAACGAGACLAPPRAASASLAAIAADVASGLAALHAAGVAHGDLTSTNVLLSAAGPASPLGWTARLADFGLASPCGGGHADAAASAPPYGTVTHMPPEALSGSAPGPSPAGDVWAYGVLLWEAAHGSRAWASMPHARVVATVAVEHARLAWSPGAPRWAADLAAACWADEPADRPTAAALVEAVAAARAAEREGVEGEAAVAA